MKISEHFYFLISTMLLKNNANFSLVIVFIYFTVMAVSNLLHIYISFFGRLSMYQFWYLLHFLHMFHVSKHSLLCSMYVVKPIIFKFLLSCRNSHYFGYFLVTCPSWLSYWISRKFFPHNFHLLKYFFLLIIWFITKSFVPCFFIP